MRTDHTTRSSAEWVDFSPEPIEFARRGASHLLGPLTPLLGVLGAMLVGSLALLLG